MSLKKEAAEKLKSVLGIDIDKLVAAITAQDEQDFTVPDVVVLSQQQLTERDNVKLTEGKKLGESEAKATLVKELGKRLNAEFKSERLGDLANEISTFANKSKDDQVKLLQDQVNALLADKTTLANQLQEKETAITQARFDNELIGFFPANRGAGLTDAERLTLIKNAITFETVDGKPVAKRNGEVVRDPATQAPLPVNKVIETYFQEKPLLLGVPAQQHQAGGRGAGDAHGTGGTGLKRFSEVEKSWKEQNPEGNVMSTEFQSYVNKVAKETPDFDYYA
ncbi:hypothetical protein [Hydrotalea sp.]|uniref:hypothetical protein n=1 Tax=Hydrotalea sp. TaxID=2881279 RepID=UPI00262AEAB8|nr:hypothetical protein [Hydrotalea sp.]